MPQFSNEQLIDKWEKFLNLYCKERVIEAVSKYPEITSIFVNFLEIDQHDPALAEYLLNHPNNAIYTAEKAILNMDMPVEEKPHLNFRVKKLPDNQSVRIRNLRGPHMGKFISIESSIVKRTVQVKPKIEDAAFQCSQCGAIIQIPQSDSELQEPVMCFAEQGGCGRKTTFKLLTDQSVLVDSQKIEVQEKPEGLRGGAQPQRLTAFIEKDLAGTINPGDRVVLNGVLIGYVRRAGNIKQRELNIVFIVNSIEVKEQAFEEIEISPEEEAKILELSKDPGIYEKIIDSIAPEIYGLRTEKEGLMLQMFGGVAKELPSESRIRGDTHILMIGDPGTAKSMLSRYISKLAPRAVYTSGKSSSAAGLTAAAVKDPFGEGGWTLEAGALVLADMGSAIVDELDKMSAEDRSALHQAMEQQEVSIAKAGITATLKTRCSLLVAANPKTGRFDQSVPIADQISDVFPPTLLSRFDLIFIITDKLDPGEDDKLASLVLSSHRSGEINSHVKRNADGMFTQEEADTAMRSIKPDMMPDDIRKYVAYAKRNCFPVMTQEAMDAIKSYYLNLRRQARGQSVPMTARQLEAFVRLAEASAKVRFSGVANLEDAQRAIRLVDYCMRNIGYNRETGTFDIDLAYTGVSGTQRGRITEVLAMIKHLCAEHKEGAPRELIISEAVRSGKAGLNEIEVAKIIDRLKTEGSIYQPSAAKNMYRLTSD
ncbi:MAG: minichromosome maintenance protein MCM [Candidatus Thermoplasmatota archaeon]|nr:minichromosome maintenance protein MCM [Candidatus Thermoplasmatota archaeon]